MSTEKLDWNRIIHFANNGSPTPAKRVEKPEDEWLELLPPDTFNITRRKGTERAFSGEYCEAFDPGVYHCACCGEPLFDAQPKFNSSSGWPSFTEPITEQALQYHKDTSFGMTRVEVMCNTCDAHLGHVFPDGPEPTGLRFCINSASLVHKDA